MTVNVTGSGIQPCGAVTPDVLDFGNTLVGTTVTKSVTLSTCGGFSIDGLTATLSGPDADLFQLGNVPMSIGSNSPVEVNVSYSPTGIEARSLGTATFEGSDGEKATLNLFGEPTNQDDGGLSHQDAGASP